MEKLSDYMLITDLDNTIVSGDLKIAQRDIDSLKKLRALGGHYTMSTGRSYPMSLEYAQLLDLSEPAIILNGSAIYDYKNDNFLWRNPISDDAKKFAKEIIDRFEFAALEFLSDKKIYVLRENAAEKRHLGREKVTYEITDFDSIKDIEMFKALFALESKYMPELKEYIEKNCPDTFTYVQSAKWYFELLPFGSSKALANRKMLELTGRKDMKIVAIGDFYNDYEMISDADFGVTVANAPQEIKDISNLVVSTCEEGAITDLVEYMIQNLSH